MTIFLIILTAIASILLILAVLVQNPKSGMAANFGASNQVMGARQTADFLEKFTWGAAVAILALALLIVVAGKFTGATTENETEPTKIENTTPAQPEAQAEEATK
ncbi:MAG: preprotein translocase subunit SecG [Alistipes sp.]|jgi:preprotein translocase subunit SecG|nr:preprotein translocase subunit SecG [Alistipes sp.]MBQ5836806.1 preprotein translocase subunit SecG [Alistipes sp.]